MQHAKIMMILISFMTTTQLIATHDHTKKQRKNKLKAAIQPPISSPKKTNHQPVSSHKEQQLSPSTSQTPPQSPWTNSHHKKSPHPSPSSHKNRPLTPPPGLEGIDISIAQKEALHEFINRLSFQEITNLWKLIIFCTPCDGPYPHNQ